MRTDTALLKLHQVGESIHVSDLALPEGVTSVDLSHGEENNQPVAACTVGAEGNDGTAGSKSADDEGDKAEDFNLAMKTLTHSGGLPGEQLISRSFIN